MTINAEAKVRGRLIHYACASVDRKRENLFRGSGRGVEGGKGREEARLTKHHRHDSLSVNTPPSNGPMLLLSATTTPVIP